MNAHEKLISAKQPNETVRLDVRLENEVQKKELIESNAYLGAATVDMLAERGRAEA